MSAILRACEKILDVKEQSLTTLDFSTLRDVEPTFFHIVSVPAGDASPSPQARRYRRLGTIIGNR